MLCPAGSQGAPPSCIRVLVIFLKLRCAKHVPTLLNLGGFGSPCVQLIRVVCVSLVNCSGWGWDGLSSSCVAPLLPELVGGPGPWGNEAV